jgi:hypothetical protein
MAQQVENIKIILDYAIENSLALLCILKSSGLTKKSEIYDSNPTLYRQINFKPHFENEGWYIGNMYYPDNTHQGIMDFEVNSFESVVVIE